MGELYRVLATPDHVNCTTIENAVLEYIEKARRIFGEAAMAKLSKVYVEFYPRGKNTAVATYGTERDTGNIVGIIQFSLQHVMRKLLVMVKQIIPHELAHVICMINGWDMGHGKVWRQVCMLLGGNGNTGSGLSYVDGRLRSLHEAKCDVGNVYWLTTTQKKAAEKHGIIVANHLGENLTLTGDSLTGIIKAL